MGHTPNNFPEEFPEEFRKDPGNALKVFPEIPLEAPVHFQNSFTPPIRLGTLFFFSEVVPERASQSRSWNFQQYWGHFWCKRAKTKSATTIFAGLGPSLFEEQVCVHNHYTLLRKFCATSWQNLNISPRQSCMGKNIFIWRWGTKMASVRKCHLFPMVTCSSKYSFGSNGVPKSQGYFLFESMTAAKHEIWVAWSRFVVKCGSCESLSSRAILDEDLSPPIPSSSPSLATSRLSLHLPEEEGRFGRVWFSYFFFSVFQENEKEKYVDLGGGEAREIGSIRQTNEVAARDQEKNEENVFVENHKHRSSYFCSSKKAILRTKMWASPSKKKKTQQICQILRWPDSRESIRRFAQIARFSRIVSGLNFPRPFCSNRASAG